MRSWWGAAAVLAVLLAGCTTGSPAPERPEPSDTPSAQPTTLAAYDSDEVAVTRAPFCDRVSPTGIEHALGDAAASSHREYGNGDRIRLPDGTRTISHEYGCEWRGGDGTVARAWVFVPPIARGRAAQLVQEAVAGRCSRTGAGEFGTPSVATRCRTGRGFERSWRGLFGDAWLVCSLTGRSPSEITAQQTGEWCVAVLEAARA